MTARPATRLRADRAPKRSRDDEDGFVLLESLLSITLLVFIMAAMTTFLITATDSTNSERTRQIAVHVTDTQLGLIDALPAADLPLGRTSTKVNAQFAAAPAVVTPWLATMTKAVDARSATLTLPMTLTNTIGGTVFTVATYLGWCSLPASAATGTDCTNTVAATTEGTDYLRAVVAVTWTARGCPADNCAYVDTTLLSTSDDPVFTLNESPPATAIVANPGDQVSAVNDVVNLPLNVSTSTGVPPFTWQISNLPAGLSMSATGVISGKPKTVQNAQPVTATVTDAFLRTTTVTFNWTILPDLIPVVPSSKTGYLGLPISVLNLTAAGGSGAPFTWTDPTGSLPPGLSVSSAGAVSGTPSARGVYPVKLVVQDSSGRQRPLAFTWTITWQPLNASQAARISQLNASVGSIPLVATGGSGGYIWTDPGSTLPPGLVMSTGGVVTGTPTTAGTYAVKLTVADPAAGAVTSPTFSWKISTAPSITGLAATFKTSSGASVSSQSFSYFCPTTDCTFAVSGAPAGVGLSLVAGGSSTASVSVTNASGTVYFAGLVTSGAGTSTVKVTPTDNVNAAIGTAASSVWTIVAKPAISGLVTLKTSVGATIADQTLTYSCPTANCTFSVIGAPAGIWLATAVGGPPFSSVSVSDTSGTLYLRGTIASSTPLGTFVVTLGTRDNTTDSTGSSSSTWTLLGPMRLTDPGPLTTSSGSAATWTLGYTCLTTKCQIRVSGQPSGIGIGATSLTTSNTTSVVSVNAGSGNVYVSGRVDPNSMGSYTVTTTIADPANSSLPSSAVWTVIS